MKSGVIRYAAVAVVMLMVVDQTRTLTTFGTNKNTDDPPKSPTQPPVRGRECKNDDSVCATIQNSICMRDSRDEKKRCLCVNKSPPTNGQCPKLPKALKSICSGEKECIEGAHCTPTNNTTASGTSKACMCKEGFMEEDHMCSSGYVSVFPSIATLVAAYSLYRLTASTV